MVVAFCRAMVRVKPARLWMGIHSGGPHAVLTLCCRFQGDVSGEGLGWGRLTLAPRSCL